MPIFPMLAAKIERLEDLEVSPERWLYASPKIDGIRCIVQDGVPLTRSLKPVPNRFVQAWARVMGPYVNGCDGELVVGPPTGADVFRRTSSALMSHEGEPHFTFWVFDRFDPADDYGFETRLQLLKEKGQISIHVELVGHRKVMSHAAIEALDELYLAEGYEGLMLRNATSGYLQKRATLKSRALMKLKRFEDSEAVVVGVIERMHNANEAKTNALGRTERSSHKENMIPTGTMGALKVRDLKTGVEFEVGTGFSDADRAWWWERSYHGRVFEHIIKYRYFPTGSKDKPRFPVFCGVRDVRDIS